MLKRNVLKWYKQFKGGRENVEDEDRSGRPSPTNNMSRYVRGLADGIGISKGSANTILKDILDWKRVRSRLKQQNFRRKRVLALKGLL